MFPTQYSNIYSKVKVTSCNTSGRYLLPFVNNFGGDMSVFAYGNLEFHQSGTETVLAIGCEELPSSGKYGKLSLGHGADMYTTSIISNKKTYSSNVQITLPSTTGTLAVVSLSGTTLTINT